MELTKDFLEKEISSLRQQEQQHLAAANAANGAIQAYQSILQYLPEKQSLTVSDLEELTGGSFQGIEKVEK